MKQLSSLFCLLASLNAFAVSRNITHCFGPEPCPDAALAPNEPTTGYSLAVHTEGPNQKNFFLSFATREQYAMMCPLTVDELTLTNQVGSTVTGRDLAIHIKTSLNPANACLASPGPHAGAVRLSRGYSLPSLSDGRYMIYVNGEWMGALILSGDQISVE